MRPPLPSAQTLASLVASGQLTAEESVQASLDRIAAQDAEIEAWVYLDSERALEEARQVDCSPARRGPLAGVPIGVKDVIDVASMPTAYGTRLYRGCKPARDASCVALARASGAVVVGKTVTTEFAYRLPGRTRNPHGDDRTPGGSSSGSAAAVAAGMVPLAFGTQTAGSVIRPASFCGVVGYKPSYGLISRAGVWWLAESLDTVGALATSVCDAGLLVGASAGLPELAARSPIGRPPRIAVCRTGSWELAQPAARNALALVASVLETSGATVVDADPPLRFEALAESHATIVAFEAARVLAHENNTAPGMLSPQLRQLIGAGFSCPRSMYEAALRFAEQARRELAAFMEHYDALLTPSAAGEAPPRAAGTGDRIFNRVWTLLRAPCLSLPAPANGRELPVGVQLVGVERQDSHLLDVAAWVEGILAAASTSQRTPGPVDHYGGGRRKRPRGDGGR